MRGFGCVFPEKGLWTFGAWPREFILQRKPNIMLLELYRVVVVVDTWAPLLRNKQIHLCSDNMSTVYELNKKSSHNIEHMALICHLTHTCLFFQIYMWCLSRAQEAKLFQQYFIMRENTALQREDTRMVQKWANIIDIHISSNQLEEIAVKKVNIVKCWVQKNKQYELKIKEQKAVIRKEKWESREKTLISMKKSKGKEIQRKWLEDLQFRQHMGASKKKPKVIGAKKPMYKSPLGSKKKFNFSHMRASKCADTRRYIAVPNTKEAKMTAEELRKELLSEATELAKPMVCKSMFLTNILVKKFNELIEELREEKVPNPHRALMFLGYLKDRTIVYRTYPKD